MIRLPVVRLSFCRLLVTGLVLATAGQLHFSGTSEGAIAVEPPQLEGIEIKDFGRAVAFDSRSLVVTGWVARRTVIGDQAAVFFFEREIDRQSGDTTWALVNYLILSGIEPFEDFGKVAILQDDLAAVGAPGDTYTGQESTAAGSVFVFGRKERADGEIEWIELTKLTAERYSETARFGESLAMAGDRLFVGAPGAKVGAHQGRGAVYVYESQDASDVFWEATQKILPEEAASRHAFGASLGFSGTDLLVGDPLFQPTDSSYRGAVYVFRLSDLASPSAHWTQVQRLIMDAGAGIDRFGQHITGKNGQAAIVGERGSGPVQQKTIFTIAYDSDSALWRGLGELRIPQGAAGGRFTGLAAMTGELIAAPVEPVPALKPGDEAVLLYSLRAADENEDKAGWEPVTEILLPERVQRGENSQFGISLDLTGKSLAIAAAGVSFEQPVKAGAIFVLSKDEWQRMKIGHGIRPNLVLKQTRFAYPGIITGHDLKARTEVIPITRTATGNGAFELQPKMETGPGGFASQVDQGNGRWIACAAPGRDAAQRGSVFLVAHDADRALRVTIEGEVGPNHESIGKSVSRSGDLVVIGAPALGEGTGEESGSGRAFVLRNNGGEWALEAVLGIGAANHDAGFGTAVQVQADVIAVGAPGFDNNEGDPAGAVFLYLRDTGSPAGWRLAKTLNPTNASAPETGFGVCLRLDDEILLIGASDDVSDNGEPCGSVYLHRRHRGGRDQFGLVKRLTPSTEMAGSGFGMSISRQADAVLVGAPNETVEVSRAGADELFFPDQGAVYVFRRDEGGLENWGEAARLVAEDGRKGDRFGASVDLAGDFMAVGAPGAGKDGRVYLLYHGEDWRSKEKRWLPFSQFDSEKFGTVRGLGQSLRLTTSELIIGAVRSSGDVRQQGGLAVLTPRSQWRNRPEESEKGDPPKAEQDVVREVHGGADPKVAAGETIDAVPSAKDESGEGLAVAVERAEPLPAARPVRGRFGSISLNQAERLQEGEVDADLLAIDGLDGSEAFGEAIACREEWVVVGAPRQTVSGKPSCGSAYIFRQSAGGWEFVQELLPTEQETLANFGRSVALGDGFLAVGAPGQGRVYVYQQASPTTRSWILVATLEPGEADPAFGEQLAAAWEWLAVGGKLGVTLYEHQPGKSPAVNAHTFLSLPCLHEGAARLAMDDDLLAITGVQVEGASLALGMPAAAIYQISENKVWERVGLAVITGATAAELLKARIATAGGTIVIVPTDGSMAWIFNRDRGRHDQWRLAGRLAPPRVGPQRMTRTRFENLSMTPDQIFLRVQSEEEISRGESSSVLLQTISRPPQTGQWRAEGLFEVPSRPLPSEERIGLVCSKELFLTGGMVLASSEGGKSLPAILVSPIPERNVAVDLFATGGGSGSSEEKETDLEPVINATLMEGPKGASSVFSASLEAPDGFLLVGDLQASAIGHKQAGQVWIYRKIEGENALTPPQWRHVTSLYSPEPKEFEAFGTSIVSNGRLLAISAPGAIRKDVETGFVRGTLTLYQRLGTGNSADNWKRIGTITAPHERLGTLFGYGVGFDGRTLAIGAPLAIGLDKVQSGRVYVYQVPEELEEQPEIPWAGAPPEEWEMQVIPFPLKFSGAFFGSSVTVEGDTMAISAPGVQVRGRDDLVAEGAVLVFERRQATGKWKLTGQVMADSGDQAGGFGTQIELNEGILYVGNPRATMMDLQNPGLSHPGQGSLSLYKKDHGGTDQWGLLQRLTANPGGADIRFGEEFVISDNLLAVAAPASEGETAEKGAGLIYTFEKANLGRWRELAVVRPPADTSFKIFGTSLAISDQMLIAGSVHQSDAREGAFWTLSPPLWGDGLPILLNDPGSP